MNNLKLLKFTVLVLLLGIVSTNGLLAQNSPMSGENFNLPLGELDPGQEVIITFDVTVDVTIPPNVTQVCNQGLVSGTNFSDVLTYDPDVGGSSDPTCTPVEQPPPSGSTIVINEVDYDQPGTDAAEFIELKNISGSPIDLTGWTVELVNGTGGGAIIYHTIDLSGVLAAGDYFVICGNSASAANCDLEVTPNTNLIQNGAPDAIGLRNPAGVLVDAVSYEGDTGAPYTEGSGTGLEDPSSSDNIGISRFPDGIDTDQNNVDFVSSCITPGGPNFGSTTCPIEPIVINEVDYDQPGTDAAEFIELKNTSDSPIDLTNWTVELVQGVGGGATIYNTILLPAVSLAAGDYFVICGNAANCDLEVSPSTNLIQNGAPDAIGLRNPAGILVDAVSYEGDTGAPYTEGSGTGLLDPGSSGNDNIGISRFPDGIDTDQNNVDFVSSCITPGGPNIGSTTCPTVDVTIDIKPQSCPNPLNVKKKGVIPVAILGTGDFDVLNIDPATVLFEGVAPIRWAIEDVTTPAAGGEQCDCTTDGPDGFDDLTLKFDAQELVAALGSVNNGDELELTITGSLLDGTPIEGSDCVIIKAKNFGKHLTLNSSNVPEEYALFENFPNPFNPSTTIQFAVPEQSFVKLEVYNSLGEKVTTLVSEELEAGTYSFNWDATNLPSGVYIYSIQSRDFFESKKMILMK